MSKKKKLKSIDPIEGLSVTMEALEKLSLGEKLPHRRDVFRDEFNNIVVDTCCAPDTGMWETGISKEKGRNFIIVEQYENREKAKIGHQRWVKKMKKNPDLELKDIRVWDF